jgi:hypothetical protein
MESKVAALEAQVVDMGARMAAMQGAHGAQMAALQGAHGAQLAAMQARMAAMEANVAVLTAPLAATAAYHAVLMSPDLFGELFPWLDRASKAALRSVSVAMRSQVDGSIKVVASPASGCSADSLSAALVCWPAVRDLTLLAVSDASELQPLATSSLAGLTSLTVRQVGGAANGRMALLAWRPAAHAHATPMPIPHMHAARAWQQGACPLLAS